MLILHLQFEIVIHVPTPSCTAWPTAQDLRQELSCSELLWILCDVTKGTASQTSPLSALFSQNIMSNTNSSHCTHVFNIVVHNILIQEEASFPTRFNVGQFVTDCFLITIQIKVYLSNVYFTSHSLDSTSAAMPKLLYVQIGY